MSATVSFIGTGNMGTALIKGLSGLDGKSKPRLIRGYPIKRHDGSPFFRESLSDKTAEPCGPAVFLAP